MGRKPKAGGTKGKVEDPEQFARFLEAAREAGVDETGEALEQVFEKITRAPAGSAKPSLSTPKRPAKDHASGSE